MAAFEYWILGFYECRFADGDFDACDILGTQAPRTANGGIRTRLTAQQKYDSKKRIAEIKSSAIRFFGVWLPCLHTDRMGTETRYGDTFR